MIYLLAFVALVLATARATRVIVIDEVAAPLRNWVLRTWPVPSKPSKLIRCYWCAGFWVALVLTVYAQAVAVFAGWLPYQSLALIPITTFAVAYAAAWVLDREEAGNGA